MVVPDRPDFEQEAAKADQVKAMRQLLKKREKPGYSKRDAELKKSQAMLNEVGEIRGICE